MAGDTKMVHLFLLPTFAFLSPAVAFFYANRIYIPVAAAEVVASNTVQLGFIFESNQATGNPSAFMYMKKT
jgi:hypothetical protein